MEPMNCVLVFKSHRHLREDEMRRLADMADLYTQRLAENGNRPLAISPDISVYWLRPGQSTDMLDAEAERIRNGEPLPTGVT